MGRTLSPNATGEPITAGELAEAMRAWLVEHRKVRDPAIDQRYILKILRGDVRFPNADYRAAMRAVLAVETDAELGLQRTYRSRTARPNVDDVHRRQLLQTLAGAAVTPVAAHPLANLISPTHTPAPNTVDLREINGVRTMSRTYTAWDHEFGSGFVRDAATAHLRYVIGLLDANCPEKLRDELYDAVGSFAHTAGFIAFDAYDHDTARRLFEVAQGCAEERGHENWLLRAKVLSSRARQEIWVGNADEGLTLAELALVRSERVTATMRAMLHTARARALAKLARVKDTIDAITVADNEFGRSEPHNDPAFMKYYDHAQHMGDTGHALWDLAVHDIRWAPYARKRLAAAVAGHSSRFARSRAISGIKLATLEALTGDPAEATQVGLAALDDFGTMQSCRARTDLIALHDAAARRHRGRELAGLHQQVRQRLIAIG